MQRMKAPVNAKQVKSFLGMAGFYRQFIEKFAQRASPLSDLLQKDVVFQWGDKQQKAFDDLKRAMMTTPVLAFPDFSRQFEVHTDASGCGIAATLIQRDEEGKPHPVTFVSRKLKKEEMAYPPAELECLAIVCATAMLRVYLEGRKFLVVTDHFGLTFLKSKKREFDVEENGAMVIGNVQI